MSDEVKPTGPRRYPGAPIKAENYDGVASPQDTLAYLRAACIEIIDDKTTDAEWRLQAIRLFKELARL